MAAGEFPQLLWGFYQEVNYRGILQTELTRRLGRIWSPLAANVFYTFGPLHFYHFTSGSILGFDRNRLRRHLPCVHRGPCRCSRRFK